MQAAGPAWALRARPVAAFLTVLAVLLAGGCERRSDTPPPDAQAPAARIVVTADLGARELLDGRVAPGGTVMDGLRALTPVRTAYGGGFVDEMLGLGTDEAGQRAWRYWVDGVLADRGAAEVRLAAGQVAWWDHHDWGGAGDVWAVVGAWPLPFTRAPAVVADAPLDAALRAAGARVAPGGHPWRVRVGSDAALRRTDPSWAAAAGDPRRAGLTATIADGRVLLLDAAGERLAAEPSAAAVAVAFPAGAVPSEGVVMAVAGTDAEAAEAAAATIARDPGVLANRVAVAFDAAGRPVRAAGRSGP